ncbi:hypothetical protein Moror_2227 [Moniliophthora roreri MCA 2997]|uniref:Uncharacterized protein n=1 Tax=Moniliophthora roreri (strain MCA 2997) TaxID=1381753 RepID=V2WQ32_MONRO|nr:hypothetical protein Moror_2227 [Moniliophthora roreri MCA 2997]
MDGLRLSTVFRRCSHVSVAQALRNPSKMEKRANPSPTSFDILYSSLPMLVPVAQKMTQATRNEPENRADVNQILNPTRKELMPEEINFKIWRSCKEAGA